MPPEPIMHTVSASARARSLVPSPAVPPTRMCCIQLSFSIASGSPFSELNSSTTAQFLPGSTEY